MYALCALFKVEGDVSEIARQGSGSACRSVYGGFVQWHMGSSDTGTDSIATQIKQANHWDDLRILILVVSLLKSLLRLSKTMRLFCIFRPPMKEKRFLARLA